MRIQVAPAKREGATTTIFNEPLEFDSINAGDDEDIEFTFCAAGLYDPRSKYRYTVKITRGELKALTDKDGQ